MLALGSFHDSSESPAIRSLILQTDDNGHWKIIHFTIDTVKFLSLGSINEAGITTSREGCEFLNISCKNKERRQISSRKTTEIVLVSASTKF